MAKSCKKSEFLQSHLLFLLTNRLQVCSHLLHEFGLLSIGGVRLLQVHRQLVVLVLQLATFVVQLLQPLHLTGAGLIAFWK